MGSVKAGLIEIFDLKRKVRGAEIAGGLAILALLAASALAIVWVSFSGLNIWIK